MVQRTLPALTPSTLQIGRTCAGGYEFHRGAVPRPASPTTVGEAGLGCTRPPPPLHLDLAQSDMVVGHSRRSAEGDLASHRPQDSPPPSPPPCESPLACALSTRAMPLARGEHDRAPPALLVCESKAAPLVASAASLSRSSFNSASPPGSWPAGAMRPATASCFSLPSSRAGETARKVAAARGRARPSDPWARIPGRLNVKARLPGREHTTTRWCPRGRCDCDRACRSVAGEDCVGRLLHHHAVGMPPLQGPLLDCADALEGMPGHGLSQRYHLWAEARPPGARC